MKELKGTTTIGIVCKDGVVLGSERRATMGTFIATHEAKKIYQIDDLVGMTTAGAVGDAQQLVRILSAEARLHKVRIGEPMSVRAIATLLSNILSANKYFFLVQLLVGGVDTRGPSVYSLDLLGGQIEERKVVATGSGSPIAYGVLEDQYREGMSTDEGVKLAFKALQAAMRRDAASGDGVEIVKITREGFEWVEVDELKINE
ncbi:proteasome endopeptidase complex, archaeal, beta subunit [Methanosarcinales archaeon]|nr:MAG: proteasome endopeptidase complex, archaeal, beta subunit [Methanosarcinales archaeon]